MTSTSDRARLIGFVAASGAQRLAARVANLFAGGLPFDGRAPSRLLIAPHDLRTADPTVAADIYRGRFSLSGTAVEIGAVSPFTLDPPSDAWEEELLGFSWLRHFHAADEPISRVNARALIGDWIAVQGRGHPVGWKPQVVARRIISWLAHSPAYLSQADPDFYRTVMRSLGRQLRYLARNVNSAPDGLPRLTAHLAMAYATLCISGLERLQVRAARLLAAELDRQVLPDGGHISRDPGAIPAILLELLPLRQTFLSRDLAPPQALIGAIDRMMPMVRFFRYGDGSFGLFNGMGRTPVDVVSAILAYDDSRGRVPEQAPQSGYQRLEAGKTIVLMDVGRPPPTSVSHRAHAGCLAFELSSGPARIITNCGGGATLKEEWRQAARATAAHSAVIVGNVSSARYLTHGPLQRLFGTPIISGPRDVVVTRSDTPEELVVEARHDGYRRLGIIHHRRIAVSRNGKTVEGQDRLTRSSTLFSRTRRFSIRFHLHPGVRASVSQDSRSALLALPGDETWRFSVFGSSLRLEESVYLVDPKGVRRSEQIVIFGQCGNEALIRWTFKMGGSDHVPRVRELREGEREEQVLPLTVDPTGSGDGGADDEGIDRPAEPARPAAEPAVPAVGAGEDRRARVPKEGGGAAGEDAAARVGEAGPRAGREPARGSLWRVRPRAARPASARPPPEPAPPRRPVAPGGPQTGDRPFRSLATPTATAASRTRPGTREAARGEPSLRTGPLAGGGRERAGERPDERRRIEPRLDGSPAPESGRDAPRQPSGDDGAPGGNDSADDHRDGGRGAD